MVVRPDAVLDVLAGVVIKVYFVANFFSSLKAPNLPPPHLEANSKFFGSSKVLSARMKFFRLAFGLENASLSDSPNVYKIIETYLNTLGSMQHHFDFAAKDTLPEHNRVILLAVMMLADLMLKGGEIKTCYENGTLWFSAFSPAGFSESKIEAMEKITAGAEEYDSDAQYAHILCLREYLKKADKISLRKTDEESFVVSIKM